MRLSEGVCTGGEEEVWYQPFVGVRYVLRVFVL